MHWSPHARVNVLCTRRAGVYKRVVLCCWYAMLQVEVLPPWVCEQQQQEHEQEQEQQRLEQHEARQQELSQELSNRWGG